MSLAYEVQGTGPTIIMVHGLGGTSNTFQPQAADLAKKYRVIRPDLPGAGRSAGKPAQNLVAIADSLMELSDAPAHWVGHSLGAVICQVLASRHPQAVKSLSLLGPFTEAAPAARAALADRAAKVRAEGLDWFVDTYISNSLAGEITKANPSVAAFLRESLLRQSPSHYADFCTELAAHRAVALSSIAAPTLLITGDEDKVGTVPSVTAMSQQLPDAVLLVLQQCGHWLTVERPDEVTSALERHFESVEAGAR
jgi:pimeloyl-ACP methyl ester carboxylesterase